jgi:hypothetical protein
VAPDGRGGHVSKRAKWILGTILVLTFVIPVIPGLILWLISGVWNG